MTDLSSLSAEFRPFWEYAAHGRLAFPLCDECGRFHWYPMMLCPHCTSRKIGWAPVDAGGVLYSWTIVHHPFRPADAHRLPYVVALVDMKAAPGVRLVTNVDNEYLPMLRAGLDGRIFVDRRDPDEGRIGFRPGPGI